MLDSNPKWSSQNVLSPRSNYFDIFSEMFRNTCSLLCTRQVEQYDPPQDN